MPRSLSEKDVARLAASIVHHWEGVPERAKDLCAQFGLSDEARKQMESDFRKMIGGEEVYLASKRFLEGREDGGPGSGRVPDGGGD
jgi:hypothetical protein